MKFILSILFLFFIFTSAFAVKQLKVFTDYNFFYLPNESEYIELKFQFDASSINFIREQSNLQAEIEIEINIKSDINIVIDKKYTLQSPLFKDSIVEDFFEIKRFLISSGTYELFLSFKDKNANTIPVTLEQKISVPNFHSSLSISDIQICENIKKTKEENILSKSGFDLFPRLINYFPADCSFLPTYIELYNPSSDSTDIQLITKFYSYESKTFLNEGYKKQSIKIGKVTPLIYKNDIYNLSTGKYQLIYSLLKDSLVVSSSSYIFDRTNESLNIVSSDAIVLDPAFQGSIPDDSLIYYLSSLFPICSPVEVNSINRLIKIRDNAKIRQYIQAFWLTSVGKQNAYSSWLNYKSQVCLVQSLYGTSIFKGFDTDRGRVYLKYGPPSAIASRETSPSEYPYEIWQYDKIKQFGNKRFIFYNPDLVDNHYQLLHSDMQGEIKNFKWQQILAKRNSPNQNIDDPNDGNKDHYGGESQDVFKQF
jgi:GWxTD domain-containing protein